MYEDLGELRQELKRLQERYAIAKNALERISAYGRQSPEMRIARTALKDISYASIKSNQSHDADA